MTFLQRYGVMPSSTDERPPLPQPTTNGTDNRLVETTLAEIISERVAEPALLERPETNGSIHNAFVDLQHFKYREIIKGTWPLYDAFGQQLVDDKGNLATRPINPWQDVDIEPLTGSITGEESTSSQMFIRDKDHPEKILYKSDAVSTGVHLVVENKELHARVKETLSGSGLGFHDMMLYADEKTMRKAWVTPDVYADAGNGEKYYFMVIIGNGYGGSQKAFIRGGLYRSACLNLCLSGQHLFNYNFRHVKANGNWRDEADKVLSLLSTAPGQVERFAQTLWDLKSLPMSHERSATMLNSTGVTALPKAVIVEAMTSFYNQGEKNAFALMNAYTNKLTHGNITRSSFDQIEKVTDSFLALTN